jgi:hypothetical protein
MAYNILAYERNMVSNLAYVVGVTSEEYCPV